MTSAIALIQAHHNDLLPGDADPSHYCITRLRESRSLRRRGSTAATAIPVQTVSDQ